MIKYKIITTETENGKVILTKEELETMLMEAYNDGYSECRKNYTINAKNVPMVCPTYPPQYAYWGVKTPEDDKYFHDYINTCETTTDPKSINTSTTETSISGTITKHNN